MDCALNVYVIPRSYLGNGVDALWAAGEAEVCGFVARDRHVREHASMIDEG